MNGHVSHMRGKGPMAGCNNKHWVPPPHHFEYYFTHVLDISKLFCSVVLLVEHYYTAWLLFTHLLAVVYLLRCMIDAVPHGVFIRLCD